MKTTFALLVGAAVLSSTAVAADPIDSIGDCNKAADAWKAAYNNKDAEAVANMYDAKGTLSNPFWTATGHDALLKGFKQEMSTGGSMVSITCDQSKTEGNMMFANGAYSAMAKGPDGKDAPMGGHWVAISEIHDGKPVILVHTSNIQMPPPK
jgi:ketosteroid isomerase-like protein